MLRSDGGLAVGGGLFYPNDVALIRTEEVIQEIEWRRR
jgi:hypothetical protein